MGGAATLADPIFQGLAASLMFGEVAATLLNGLLFLLVRSVVGNMCVRATLNERKSTTIENKVSSLCGSVYLLSLVRKRRSFTLLAAVHCLCWGEFRSSIYIYKNFVCYN